MLMADTMAIFLVILGLMLALPGLWLLSRALWPDMVAVATSRCGRSLWPAFLLGLMFSIATAVVIAVLFNTLGPIGKLSGAGVACLYLIYANAGVAAFVTSIGQRLSSPVDDARPWRATVRGGIVLELTYLIPLVGWFVILPITTIVGSGLTTIALLSRAGDRLFARKTITRPDVPPSSAATAGAMQ